MKMQVFRGANVKLRNWRQVTVYMLNTSTRSVENRVGVLRTHTGKCTVTACRT